MRKLAVLALGFAFVLASVPLLKAAATGYHILNEIKIGGEGGWDYLTVDSAARRLYVSHATHVVVVDLDKDTVVGDIPDTPGVHGIALAPELNKGFISNGRGNNVTIFDLKTLKATGTVATEMNPDVDPLRRRVRARVRLQRPLTQRDGNRRRRPAMAIGNIALPGKPEFSPADGKGKVYVNIEDTNEIVEIDAAKAKVTKKYALTGCEGPSGLAMDTKARRLFSVCGNRVMAVSDPDKGTVIATPADRRRLGRRRVRSGHRLRDELERRRHDDDRPADRRQVRRPREHRHRAWCANDRARREDAPRLSADCDGRTSRGRRTSAVAAGLVQSAGGRQMKAALRDCVFLLIGARECRRAGR